MKEATGELSTTVIAIVAIAAVAAIFTIFVLPSIRGAILNRTYCQGGVGCTTCDESTGKYTCTGYYDKTGKEITVPITCSCTKTTP